MARMFDFDHVGTIDIGRRGEESRYLAFRGDFTAARARSPRVALRVANRFHEKRARESNNVVPATRANWISRVYRFCGNENSVDVSFDRRQVALQSSSAFVFVIGGRARDIFSWTVLLTGVKVGPMKSGNRSVDIGR